MDGRNKSQRSADSIKATTHHFVVTGHVAREGEIVEKRANRNRPLSGRVGKEGVFLYVAGTASEQVDERYVNGR